MFKFKNKSLLRLSVIGFLFCIFCYSFNFYSSPAESREISTAMMGPELIKSSNNIPRSLRRSLRLSVVKVKSILIPTGLDADIFYRHGSGSYMIFEDRHFVITAAHVLRDSGVVVVSSFSEEVLATPVYIDFESDVAVLLIPRMDSRSPVEFNPIKFPRSRNISGENIVYAGYPNFHDEPLILTGIIAGYENDRLILQSYAWMGSSGSCIFDYRGRIVGIVSAIEIGSSKHFPPQLIESMLWASPAWNLTKSRMREILN